jgi:hypothetical protein
MDLGALTGQAGLIYGTDASGGGALALGCERADHSAPIDPGKPSKPGVRKSADLTAHNISAPCPFRALEEGTTGNHGHSRTLVHGR